MPDYDFIDYLDIGLTVTDEKLNILFANSKFRELLKLPEEMVGVGKNLKDIISFNAKRGEYGEGGIDAIINERLELFSQKKHYRFIRKRLDGSYIEVIGSPTANGGFATSYSDVTKLERSRLATEQENLDLVSKILDNTARLQKDKETIERETAIRDVVLENTPHGLTLVDKELKLVTCNKRFLELLDFPEHMAEPGTRMEDFFRYNAMRGEYGDVDVEEAVAERVAITKEFKAHSFLRQMPNGRTIEVKGIPVPMGFVTTYTDVTDMVNSHDVLEQANSKFKEIIDNSPIGMGITRISDSVFLQINPAAASLLGFDNPADAIGTSARCMWRSEAQRDEVFSSFQQNGFLISKEIQMQDILGEPFYCYLSWNPVMHENHECIFFWIYDIANKKLAQKHLYEAEKMASLGGLVAGVAHEINTPIGIAVTASSHVMEEMEACRNDLSGGKLSKSRLEKLFEMSISGLDIVLTNLQSAATLVQNFKLVSVDQISEEAREIQVSQYIEKVLSSLEPKIKKAKVEVNLHCIEDCSIYTYPGAISQVLTNLVTNSITHGFENTKGGIIDINVSGSTGNGVEIQFKDNGIGIPKELLIKVMDPFYTTKRGQGGSGLGLSIVHNVVTQALKGTINIKSIQGEGTMLYITIPALK